MNTFIKLLVFILLVELNHRIMKIGVKRAISNCKEIKKLFNMKNN